MNFNELFNYSITEANIPVESYDSAYKIIEKKIKQIDQLFKKYFRLIKDNTDFFENDIDNSYSRYIISYSDTLEERLYSEKSYERLDKAIETFLTNIDIAKKTDDGNFRYKLLSQYIPNDLTRLLNNCISGQFSQTFQNIKNEFSEFFKHAESYGYEQYQIDKMQSFYDILNEIELIGKSVRQYITNIETLVTWNLGNYHQSRSFRPDDLEEIEVAYHASIDVQNLFNNGFEQEYKGKEKGLGSGSYYGHLSFSLDLKICQTIMIAFKHMWLIVHKKWPIDKLIDYVKLYSEKNPHKDSGGVYDFNFIVKQYERNKGKVYPPKSVEDMIDFYHTSLWFLNKPVNRNPVFANTRSADWVEKLRDVRYNDIGILKAKIRTTNASEFLVAEREIRIPASDVVEMISIIQ